MSGISPVLLASYNIFGGLVFGFNVGIVAYALVSLTTIFHLDNLMKGLVTTVFLFGATIGSVFGGILCDKIGRRKVMIIMAILSIVGAVCSGLIQNIGAVFAFRVILGFGVGLSSVVCPLYVSEMAPIERRGFFATLFQLFITLGIVVAELTGFLIVKYVEEHWQWRLMFFLAASPAVPLLFIGIFLMTESPHWKGGYQSINDEAPEIYNSDPLASDKTGHHDSSASGWKELFSRRKFPQLLTGVVLSVALALTGINAVFFFALQIFENAGFGAHGNLLTVILGLWNFLCTVVSTFLVDRLNRRSLLFFGLTILTISEIVLGFAFKFLSGAWLGYVSFVCLFLFVGGFAVSPGALFWVLVSEIFHKSVRDQANGFINLLQWGFNLLLNTFFLTLVSGIGSAGSFWLLASFGFVSTVYLFIFLPETKGIDLN